MSQCNVAFPTPPLYRRNNHGRKSRRNLQYFGKNIGFRLPATRIEGGRIFYKRWQGNVAVVANYHWYHHKSMEFLGFRWISVEIRWRCRLSVEIPNGNLSPLLLIFFNGNPISSPVSRGTPFSFLQVRAWLLSWLGRPVGRRRLVGSSAESACVLVWNEKFFFFFC